MKRIFPIHSKYVKNNIIKVRKQMGFVALRGCVKVRVSQKLIIKVGSGWIPSQNETL